MTAPPRPLAAPPTRRLLALIVALFLLPFALATGLYLAGWRPAGGAHGEFVAGDARGPANAPLVFDGLAAVGASPSPSALAGHWTLVVLSAGPCDASCVQRLAALHRVHAATYKNMPRVRRLWVASGPHADAAADRLLTAWPDLVIAVPPASAWQSRLPAANANDHRVLLLDPAGRPILHYPEPFDPRDLLRDLEHLLKYSWIG